MKLCIAGVVLLEAMFLSNSDLFCVAQLTRLQLKKL